MAKTRLGELPPRYSFILNQYPDERLSKCPQCHKPTHLRKFPLLIHIDGWGLMALGKTCPYCSKCELIIAHQHELEAELTDSFSRIDPDIIGNDYLVIGTVARKFWKEGIAGGGKPGDVLQHVADFKSILELKVEPGGWYPAKPEEKK